ncbi:MAG: hypothetical protein HY063_02885 [Bacteroidetes bacterium]|nr:hypothetical protein [Bacteroidota bacterium]
MKKIFRFPFLATLFLFTGNGKFFSQDTIPKTDSLRKDAIKVFIDCYWCDIDYFRRGITFVNYVRERKEAHVHILFSFQRTASGGGAYSFFFIGQKNFSGVNDTLVYNYKADATEDEIREGQAATMKMGLMRYVSKTPLAKFIEITMNNPPSAENVKDKWRNWVCNLDASGFFNGQQTYYSISSWTSFSVDKVTKDWKIHFGIGNNYRESYYKIDDTTTVRSINRSNNFNNLLVKSISDHWSAGGFLRAENADYSNLAFKGGLSPAIEYDLFPYSQATRKQLRILYSIGYSYSMYYDTTIFNKTREGLWGERLAVALELKQKWGSVSASLAASNYMNDFSLNNIYFRPWVNIRVFKGMSVRLGGSVSLIHDQISLPKAGASLAEILLQQRQLATAYSFWGNFGITYTFGSIYNNVVNPRFND